jgi:DNA-binding transcriptional LysR family regulator
MPDIRQMQRFVAVAEYRSFRRAAASLHVSQPPLSISIRNLEDEIDVQLLLRDRKSVELTKAGEIFLERAKLILSQVDDSITLAQSVKAGLRGQISIGFFPTATYDVLPQILRIFRKTYPNVGLRFVELTTPEQPEALSQKHIDVGIFLAPTVDVADLNLEIFHRERLIVALPNDHQLAAHANLHLKELRNEKFIFIPPRWGTGYHARVSHAFTQAGFAPDVVAEVGHLHTMVSLVAAGMGIAVGASSLMNFQPPGVVFKEFADNASALYVEFGLAWRESDDGPLVESFLDSVRQFARTQNRSRPKGN